jgi:hypothetical protein
MKEHYSTFILKMIIFVGILRNNIALKGVEVLVINGSSHSKKDIKKL